METITIAGLELGAGIPKIIVPLTAETTEQVCVQAGVARESGADCVEWRIDLFSPTLDEDPILECLAALRSALGTLPLLCTIRSDAQGGACKQNIANIKAIQKTLIASGKVDLIDIELTSEAAEELANLVAFAKECGVAVVISDHNFANTPSFEVLYETLNDELKLGADICKIAVMANQEGDELQLMAAAHQFTQDFPQALTIAISMGEIGAITRLTGEFFGSCMTFCTAGASSAPGQVDIATAQRIMQQLHEEGFENSELQ